MKGRDMRNLKRIFAASLIFTLLAVPSFALTSAYSNKRAPSTVQQGLGALERGYRTGYSDGYQAGYRDALDNAPRDYRSKEDYQRGDRAYVPAYGSLEDYRDGYQQGFESGYNDGFERRTFNSDIPTGISRRDQADVQATIQSDNSSSNGSTSTSGGINTGVTVITPNSNGNNGRPYPVEYIPPGTSMTIELLNDLSTDITQRGDRFQARVIDPREYEGAIIDGRVTRVKRAGRVSGKSELQLTFDHIRFTDNTGANFEAQVVEVIDTGSSDGVGDVDPEGGVQGKSSKKDDVSKVGAATGIGAIIGAIAGGGKGAAIGAAIGAGVGTGGVLSRRGKDIRLSRGQQIIIRTSSPTRVQ
jgi:hypothetical protein